MDQKTIDVIQSTVPVLESKGEEIVVAFYHHMLETHPELRNIFNKTNQSRLTQPKALAAMIYQAARSIDHLDALLPQVQRVAEKHRSIGVKPEQYPIVGENLIWALKHVLQDAATEEVINAWSEAYQQIADVFISTENHLRDEMLKRGGWTGFAPFTVEKIVQESSVIKSFYLKPVSGNPLPVYQPGQYISVRVRVPGTDYTNIRQYSLSDTPSKHYFRISVKKEEGRGLYPDGLVSNYLHKQVKLGDTLEISAPAGEFTLHPSKRPVVFISGGIGQTPLLAMAKQLIKESPERDILWIHSAKDMHRLAFINELTRLSKQARHFTIHLALSEEQHVYNGIDRYGRIDEAWLKNIVKNTDADYYFCGPLSLMRFIYKTLTEWKIPESQIHDEFFGPKGKLIS
ncbi:NO-inducible flavohemoprotein [Sporolactobacillus sp. THM7-7]|nr:NO-inducible flavohemoprotein [Sporolactobacillus sp. THM7-7]